MEYRTDSSTYSAIFAVLLIAMIVLVVGYNAVRDILHDDEPAEKDSTRTKVENPDHTTPNGTVIYDNLTDEEADKIINQIFNAGAKNLEKIEEIQQEHNI